MLKISFTLCCALAACGFEQPDNLGPAPTDPPSTSDLMVALQSEDTILVGGSITYHLTAANRGPDPASSIVLTNRLASGVSFSSVIAAGWECDEAAGTVTCSRASLAVDETSNLAIEAIAPAEAGETVTLTSIEASSTDPNLVDNSTDWRALVTGSADLELTIFDGPDPVVQSGTLTYTVNVTNHGPSTATGVVVSSTLPAALTFVSAVGTGWSCGRVGQIVTCDRSTIAIGAAPGITLTVQAPPSNMTVVNTVTATASTGDPLLSNNSQSPQTRIGTGFSTFDGMASQTSFPTGENPFTAAIADYNGDGKLDIATVNGVSATGSILLSTTSAGATTPSFRSKVDFSIASEPTNVVAGDLNGDGRPDLVFRGIQRLSLFVNTTAPGATIPTLGQRVDMSLATAALPDDNPGGHVIFDVNADGKQDLVVTTVFNKLAVFLNTTAPGANTLSFAPRQDFATNTGSMAVGDLNGDGRLDLAIVEINRNFVTVMLNTTATGSSVVGFTNKVEFATDVQPVGVVMTDVNSDGRLDLVTANRIPATVSVLLNTTTVGAQAPSFASAVSSPNGPDPRSLAVADFNGDGLPDIVTSNLGNGQVSVLLNTSDSTPSFSAPVDFTPEQTPISVKTADINGDGKPDLVVCNADADTVSVMLSL